MLGTTPSALSYNMSPPRPGTLDRQSALPAPVPYTVAGRKSVLGTSGGKTTRTGTVDAGAVASDMENAGSVAP